MKKSLLIILFLSSVKIFAQFSLTVSTPSYIANRYVPVGTNVAIGSTTVGIVNAPSFSFSLCPGDLIMIYQAQGALVDTSHTTAYGDILNYNSAGLYEFKYVQAVNANTITVQSAFTNSYLASGRTQIVKVARYSLLVVNSGASMNARPWKDSIIGGTLYRYGGINAILAGNIVNNGTISADAAGFRGGALNANTLYPFNVTQFVSTSMADGGEKGEGIFGHYAEYDVFGGRYCRGAVANGGGGGNSVNSSGAGGGNGFNGNTWSGQGVMIVDANNPITGWQIDPGYIANSNALTNSSGGGRGGYSWGNANGNALADVPGNPLWGGDNRRELGGRGGRPLTNINAESRLYFGGGGGAGHQNNNGAIAGSNGGGIVYLIAPVISGTGQITSNGGNVPNSGGCSCDGTGGAGAGGSIVIKATTVANTQNLIANGGAGGNIVQSTASIYESEGPGGGGGGGFIASSVTGLATFVNGGLNGINFSAAVTEMPSNGSTKGAAGQTSTVSVSFVTLTPIPSTYTITSNSPVCAGSTLTLTTNYPGPYLWLGPNNFTSSVQSPTIGNASLAADGIYYLPIFGCGAGFSIGIVPQPTVTILNVTGSQSITCSTPTVDLKATTNYPGNLNFNWVSNTFTANTQGITVVSASTLITLTASDPQTGCLSTATTAIRVNTTVPVSGVSPINQFINCGPGVVATATGVAISPTVNVSHQWFGPGGIANAPSGGQISIYNPYIVGSDGINTYVLTDLINGCSTTKTIQVVSTGGAYPSFSLTSLANFTLGCSTRSVADINIVGANTNPPPGGGVVSYTMLPPAYTGTNYATSVTVPSYTVNSPGTYIMIVKDNGNQCETRIPLPVIQNTFGPNILASAATQTLSCFVPSVVLQGSSSTPNIIYTWKKNTLPPLITNSFLPVNTTTAGASVPSATVIDTFTLTIADQGNACSSNTTITIYQNTRPPKPGIAFSHTALTCAVYSVNATNNSTTGVLPGTFFATQGLRALLWQGPSPQQDLTNNSTYIGFTSGIYTMTVRDMDNGCVSVTTAVLGDARVYPVIVTNSTAVLDCGAGSAGAKLNASVVNLTAAQVDPHWDVPPTAITSTVDALNLTTDAIGIYTLTVFTKSNSCGSATTVTVTNGVLNASFSADQEKGYAPLTVNFTNSSASSAPASATQSITSVWSFGNGTTKTTTVNTTQANTSAIYTQPGTYTVTMFAVKGTCVDTFAKVIRVDIPSKLEVPNIFTPNGDNSNDIFFIKTANLSEITAMIFDRWGNKIYELTTDKGNIAWDGKNQAGKEAPDGTYFYIITATGKDGQEYNTKGNVSLYR